MFGTWILEGVGSKVALLVAERVRDGKAMLVMNGLVARIENL